MNELLPAGIACIFHIIDTLCGLLCGVKNKELQSGKMRDGLFKKCGFLFCYAIAYMVDRFGPLIGLSIPVKTMSVIVCYACVIELVSIIENISKLNPDIIPDKLLEIFEIGGKRKHG